MIDIRQRIKDLCKQKGVMQKELAAKMGITEIALSISLRPDRKTRKVREDGTQAVSYPSIETLERIANALEMDIAEFFRNDNSHQSGVHCPICGAELELKAKE